MTHSIKTALSIGIIWITFAVVIFLGLASLNVSRLVTIARNFASTEAVVVSTNCPDHASIYYTYKVNEETFSGMTRQGALCPSLRAGDRISVYYSKTEPALSEFNNPHSALIGEIGIIAAAAILFPPIGIFIVYFNRKNLRKLLLGR